VSEPEPTASSPDVGQPDLRQLILEEEALRRVAELVAAGASLEAILGAVALEASEILDGRPTMLSRIEEGGLEAVVVAQHGGRPSPGARFASGEGTIGRRVQQSGRPERIDDLGAADPSATAEGMGLRGVVGVPINLNGRLWGVLSATTADEPLPAGTEQRLLQFAQLVASAISSSDAHNHLKAISEEQAALLRVAELVASGASEKELFDVVAVEAAGLIGDEATTLIRLVGPRSFELLATWRGPAPIGTVVELAEGDDSGAAAQVIRTHRPARLDDHHAVEGPLYSRDDFGVGSSVAVPIIVDGRLWGMIGAVTEGRPLPLDAETRLEKFAGLVAGALANSQASSRLQRLADEQSALLRVAELVARGAPLQEVFDSVTAEASKLLNGMAAALMHYDTPESATVVAAENSPAPVGLRVPADANTVAGQARTTRATFRVDDFALTDLAEVAAELGVKSSVALPIFVEGNVWGILTSSSPDEPPPADADARLEELAELAGAAIANAENRAKLKASRARVIATADETRRRVQRDVHDGAQQRLVQTVITLKLIRDSATKGEVPPDLIGEALYHAERANTELRELAHGILPAALSVGGLRRGLDSLVMDAGVFTSLEFDAPRLPADIEITAYFVVAEALTNVVKHARARKAEIEVKTEGSTLVVSVRDDGKGGADAGAGSGLTGLRDRVEGADGVIAIDSPPGGGTTVRVFLPLPSDKAGDVQAPIGVT
jgi:signal transduction histidine kinase